MGENVTFIRACLDNYCLTRGTYTLALISSNGARVVFDVLRLPARFHREFLHAKGERFVVIIIIITIVSSKSR